MRGHSARQASGISNSNATKRISNLRPENASADPVREGGLAGLGLSALFLEGGQLFSIVPQSLALYLGPIALIYNVTRYQEGLNGLLRKMGQRGIRRRQRAVTAPDPQAPQPAVRTAVRLPVVVAGAVIAAGFIALGVAWYHVGNSDQVWIQNQDIVSGGLGGLALVVLGSALLIRDALLRGRALVEESSRRDVTDSSQPDASPAAASSADAEANGPKTTRRRSPGGRQAR